LDESLPEPQPCPRCDGTIGTTGQELENSLRLQLLDTAEEIDQDLHRGLRV